MMKMHDKSTVCYSKYKHDNLITDFKTYNTRSSKSTCSKPCSGVLNCTIFVVLHEMICILNNWLFLPPNSKLSHQTLDNYTIWSLIDPLSVNPTRFRKLSAKIVTHDSMYSC